MKESMRKDFKLTQKELKSFLIYNRKTGIFAWTIDSGNATKLGDVAGYVDNNGYIIISIKGKKYKSHQLAWLYVTGEFPTKNHTNHINGIKTDNRFSNLQEETTSQNICNTKMYKNNKSGFRGVSKKRSKYEAQATFKGRKYYLGSYDTPKEASKAYMTFYKNNHDKFTIRNQEK